MPISMTFSGDTVEAVHADMRRALGLPVPTTPMINAQPDMGAERVEPQVAAKKLRKELKAGTAAAQATVQEAEACMADQGAPAEPEPETESQTPEQEAPAASEAIDYDTVVKPAVLAYANKHGREATQALLKQFGVEKAPELDPSRYAELMEAMGG
ncbi:hypothetical protein [Caulobacter phage KcrB]|nr:hypothetical protein RW_GP052 [Caulobacter phage RW]WCA46356.1 hypothetical protein [Caulobacter phage KcrB]WCD56291.1 hypothetical protein [Caulobacter phage RLK]WNV48083.1 hypothetical protein GB2A_gp051 [Caulobacter phage GB2A]